MGVYCRPDSPYWWLFLETTKQKERTEFKVGETTAQRHDSRKLADDRYHQRMNEIAARLYRLPSAVPAIRFDKYAVTYKTDVIAQRRGHATEGDALKCLVTFFADDLLSSVDVQRAREYIKDAPADGQRCDGQPRGRRPEDDAPRRRAEVSVDQPAGRHEATACHDPAAQIARTR